MFVVFRKVGGFYHVFDGDSYILNYLFNYKIVGNRVGFPVGSIHKVVNTLEDKKINYELDGKKVNFKRKNNYEKYLEKGKVKYNFKRDIEKIYGKLDQLNSKDLEEILNFIEGKLGEWIFNC